jgi:hypothetical protein
MKIHIDGGANRSLTNDITLLHDFKYIKKYAMNGINSDSPALYCTGVGLLPWKAPNGDILFVKCYYSADAADTILSPTDIVITDLTDFNAWTQHSNVDTGKGYIRFHRRDQDHLTYPLYSQNGLWYTDTHGCTISDYNLHQTTPTTRYLTQSATYELYHQRFGHPGERAMRTLHLHVDDVPELKGNSFYKCSSCIHAKMRQRPFNTTQNGQSSTPHCEQTRYTQ